MQRKEEEIRQMFVERVKEKESELKDAEKEVSSHNIFCLIYCPSNVTYFLFILLTLQQNIHTPGLSGEEGGKLPKRSQLKCS